MYGTKGKKMTNQFCPFCNQLLKKVGDVYICPIHGRVLKEDSEESKGDTSYIG